MLFLYVRELRILLVNVERFLRVSFLLRRLDSGEVRARDGSSERLPGKFVVRFQCLAFSFCGSFLRANAAPDVGLPCSTGGDAVHPTF